jgi:hypothetical protein
VDPPPQRNGVVQQSTSSGQQIQGHSGTLRAGARAPKGPGLLPKKQAIRDIRPAIKAPPDFR